MIILPGWDRIGPDSTGLFNCFFFLSSFFEERREKKCDSHYLSGLLNDESLVCSVAEQILGWMHRKLRQNNADPLKDFNIGTLFLSLGSRIRGLVVIELSTLRAFSNGFYFFLCFLVKICLNITLVFGNSTSHWFLETLQSFHDGDYSERNSFLALSFPLMCLCVLSEENTFNIKLKIVLIFEKVEGQFSPFIFIYTCVSAGARSQINTFYACIRVPISI